MEFFYGAMVVMCSTTWAGVFPDISARAIVSLEVYPHNYHMQGDFPSYSSYMYQYHAVIIKFQTTFIRFLV